MTAELVVFVANGEDPVIDDHGVQALKLFKSVGVTSFVTAIQGSPSSDFRQTSTAKKRITNAISNEVFKPH